MLPINNQARGSHLGLSCRGDLTQHAVERYSTTVTAVVHYRDLHRCQAGAAIDHKYITGPLGVIYPNKHIPLWGE